MTSVNEKRCAQMHIKVSLEFAVWKILYFYAIKRPISVQKGKASP